MVDVIVSTCYLCGECGTDYDTRFEAEQCCKKIKNKDMLKIRGRLITIGDKNGNNKQNRTSKKNNSGRRD
jgi:hypothetical protein